MLLYRRGELLGLRWKDVDLEEKKLYVKSAAVEITGQGVKYKETKNKSSKRSVDFDKDVQEHLKYFLKKEFKYIIRKK